MNSSSEGRFVAPGEVVVDLHEKSDHVPGKGCYLLNNQIRASVIGYVHVKEQKEGDRVTNVVEIQISEFVDDALMPEEGRVVTAIVSDIGPQWAQCHLLSMEDRRIDKDFEYRLPKNNMRDTLFASEIEVLDCVQPGDIILARIVDYSFRQRAYVLTIAEEELGVVYAQGVKSRLRPLDFETVIDDRTGVKEKRKVAKVPMYLNASLFDQLTTAKDKLIKEEPQEASDA
ncbi:unnamed protein product, partial [Mesorhabditis spiculigera]